MASQDTTTSGFDAVLKDFYEGTVRTHLNQKTTLLKHIEKSQRSWSGRQVLFPVNLRRSSGVGARAESGTLPVADRQRYADCKIGAKFLYGRIEITGPVIEASRGDKGAFASALRSEIDGMRRDLRDDVNRQLYGNNTGDSASGILAKNNFAAGTGADPAFDGGTGLTTFTVDSPGSRYIKPGMTVAIGTAAELTGTGAPIVMTVATVPSRTTFTVSGDQTALLDADNDLVVRGDASDTSFNKELAGLSDIVANNTDLQTITIAAFPEWKANVLENTPAGTNRALSLELMQLAVDTTDEVGGSEPDLIIGHHSVRREYVNLLNPDVRYSPESLTGGFRTLTYTGGTEPITIEFDKHASYNQLYFLNSSDLRWYVQKDWGWANRDGSVMNRKQNQDAWEAFMCFYGNLGAERRNTQTVLKDVSASNEIF